MPGSRKVQDPNDVARRLTHTFNKVTSALPRAARDPKTKERNRLYIMQTEFAYRLNELTLCGPGAMQYNIARCNEYIDQVMQEIMREQQ